MLSYNELKPGKIIIFEDQPYVVVEYNFLRMQQRKPVAQTKIKNLMTGKTAEKTFHPSDKFHEADLETKPIKYLYANKGEFWFCEKDNPSKRFTIESEKVGENFDLIKQNTLVDVIMFGDQIVGLKLPIKVELKVTEAPPSTKGNTAQGGSKQVKVETGASINTPLFVNEGDTISINTETREYSERVR